MSGFFSANSSWRAALQRLNLAATVAAAVYLLASEDAKGSELAFKMLVQLVTAMGLRDNNSTLTYISSVILNGMALGTDYSALTMCSSLPDSVNYMLSVMDGVNLGTAILNTPEEEQKQAAEFKPS
ncbi:hypothetical protein Lqui_1481 [Legionella quinlivanii]|uniref:Uncharacterized protein n=1 Tax=Legionella quinlivanii TaxID=45073 RepID=A0A0W0XZL1_9GAMM|nr:hypothetical protein [Legionella quinlivanii]KTD50156.1 hypothetical protein Lqui_1481 [Legionella quinlivanii]MCW8450099.1 hypothetical protein [Legionella quinlivanii]SEF49249.1 hypothetical protein SAMN02746093_00356 [Legionella quinlivanii DSM 21216]STY11754.1 Uncharacterised protein [Legionella quinlivanii]